MALAYARRKGYFLAGWILKDFQQPGDITAAKRLDVSGDLVQRQNHVLKVAYESLAPERMALLSRIACFRSAVKYEALKALALNYPSPREGELDTDLRDLIVRGLLNHDIKENRFDLHPIVRRYTYDRLATSDRTTTHMRLRDYFAAVPKSEKVTCLEDLAPVIELYHHTVRAGQFDEAFKLFRDRLSETTYYQLGAYQLRVDLLCVLFQDGEEHAPNLRDESDQALMLNGLANLTASSACPDAQCRCLNASMISARTGLGIKGTSPLA